MADLISSLSAISGYSVLIPLAVCLVFHSKIPAAFRKIIWFVWIATLGEIVSRILYTVHVPGLPALHLYTLAEGIVLLLFYRDLLKKKYSPAVLSVVVVLFAVFATGNSAFVQSIHEVNSNARTLEASLIIISAIVYYFLLFESDDRFLFKKPLLWINSGIFLYFSMSLLFFVFGNYLMQHYSTPFNTMIWRLHTIFLIIFHIILARGIWLLGKKAGS